MPEDVPAVETKGKDPAWATLVVAGLLEPVWVTAMKLSEGFTDVIWGAATFVFLFFSMYLLGKALKMNIPMGTAYAVWVGIGAIGALVVGILSGLRDWASFELFPDLFGVELLDSPWFWLSLAAVLASAVFPMMWCRVLCPTGAVLDTVTLLARPRRATRHGTLAGIPVTAEPAAG